MMSSSIGSFGRIWRLILGFLLTTWSVAGGPSWGYIGVYLILSGSFGFSIVAQIFSSRDKSQDF